MLRFAVSFVRLLALLLLSVPTASATDRLLGVEPTDPIALQEATRILAEEVKLAARPQPYVIVDLVDGALMIKARGTELRRFPIEQWSAVHLAHASMTFRLQGRPPVARRKIEPAGAGDQPPVSLDDMPTDFALVFSPALLITVHPSASDDTWRWLQFTVREWWAWLKDWIRRLATGTEPPEQPVLRLTLTAHHAQSVAWSVTSGMPFLVRRTPSPP